MKKRFFSLLFSLLIIFNIFVPFDFALILNVQAEETGKRNAESYWSSKNAPIFYGATKITLKKGIINKFDLNDTRFRIFAKDFEDGDLTTKIIAKGHVDPYTVGNYELNYVVTDSHGNETTLTVPVIVTDDENASITVERTIYTIPSVWNMDLVGFSRCNYGDRQILGVYMPSGSSIKARILEADSNINIAYITDDAHKETSQTLKTDGEWVTLQNISNQDKLPYDSVPVLTSTVLAKDKTDLKKTYKIELQYDNAVSELTYYHYQDNEEAFFTNWRTNQNTYAVIENEVLTIVVPFHCINELVRHNVYDNSFNDFDTFLEYYQKVVNKMDEYVGLDLNPVKITDQNVRTKYLIRANAHGAGAAYYSGNHVGINSAHIHAFFQMNWGGLHELAHGYQGSLGKGEMQLGEVGNNIIGHYIQTDKDIYFYPGDWLGSLPNIEGKINEERQNGKTFLDYSVGDRLYIIINLLDAFEGGKTYGKMFSWYREQVYNKRTMTNQDAYVEALADIYHVNIIPYMEAWGLTINDAVKETVYSKNYPLLNMLGDVINSDNLQDIMQNEQINRQYAPVTNEVFNNYDIKSSLTINIDIDDINKLMGKKIVIKDEDKIVKTIIVNNQKMVINDLPVGTYYIQMPILNEYNQDYLYVSVNDTPNAITYHYTKNNNEVLNNKLYLLLRGNYDTYGYRIDFDHDFNKALISFGQAGYSFYKDVEVTIYDELGNIISKEIKGYNNLGEVKDDGIYFNFTKESYEINLKPGYRIEITHDGYNRNRVVWFSTLNNQIIEEYAPTAKTTTYIITDKGIRREDMSVAEMEEITYNILKNDIISKLKNYEANVSEEELNNKNINFKQKAELIQDYYLLKDNDRQAFTNLINRVSQGGKPQIALKGKTTYYVGEKINLYTLISAIDNEDGIITIDNETTKINGEVKKQAGKYQIIYQVHDADNNVTTYPVTIEIKVREAEVDPNKTTSTNKTTSSVKKTTSTNSTKVTTSHNTISTTKKETEKTTNNQTTNSINKTSTTSTTKEEIITSSTSTNQEETLTSSTTANQETNVNPQDLANKPFRKLMLGIISIICVSMTILLGFLTISKKEQK